MIIESLLTSPHGRFFFSLRFPFVREAGRKERVMLKSTTRFPLGQIVATPAALEALKKAGQSASEFISMHASGDCGIVCEEDKEANEQSLKDGSRILSAYRLTDGTKIWIITEADRSSTCILLPEEY